LINFLHKNIIRTPTKLANKSYSSKALLGITKWVNSKKIAIKKIKLILLIIKDFLVLKIKAIIVK
jgi:hypothetical protein